MTPDGKQGMDITTTYFNYKKTYGRGVARMRPTNYNQYGLWLDDQTDLRHNVESGNWMVMEKFKYNHPKLFTDGNPYAGKIFVCMVITGNCCVLILYETGSTGLITKLG